MHPGAIYMQNSASDDHVFNDVKCLNHSMIEKNKLENGRIPPYSKTGTALGSVVEYCVIAWNPYTIKS